MTTVCILMASGLGRRFGGDKLMAEFCGEPMICRALAATDGVFDRRVVLTRSAAAAKLCRDRGVPVLLHSEPRRCDAMRLGLTLANGADGVLFCPCDQPLLRRSTVQALRAAFAADPRSIWRPAWQGRPGAPVLFPRWALGELAALQSGGGRRVMARHPGAVRTVPATSAAELEDVDTPQDLARLERLATD